jgi:hypothetical protein
MGAQEPWAFVVRVKFIQEIFSKSIIENVFVGVLFNFNGRKLIPTLGGS